MKNLLKPLCALLLTAVLTACSAAPRRLVFGGFQTGDGKHRQF